MPGPQFFSSDCSDAKMRPRDFLRGMTEGSVVIYVVMGRTMSNMS
jgi:hypothetical protein